MVEEWFNPNCSVVAICRNLCPNERPWPGRKPCEMSKFASRVRRLPRDGATKDARARIALRETDGRSRRAAATRVAASCVRWRRLAAALAGDFRTRSADAPDCVNNCRREKGRANWRRLASPSSAAALTSKQCGAAPAAIARAASAALRSRRRHCSLAHSQPLRRRRHKQQDFLGAPLCDAPPPVGSAQFELPASKALFPQVPTLLGHIWPRNVERGRLER